MTKILSKEIAFNGKLRTAIDGASIGANDFQTLENLRPTETNVRPVAGMTKINTSALGSLGLRNGFHFRKSQPAESHVLAWTSDGKVWVYDGSVPAQGALTLLYTDTAGGSTGRFANAPGGALAYANGVEACLWGGTEHRCSGFIDFPATGQIYDYSDLITNTKNDAQNVATIHAVQNAADANTMLLLHLDNNVTDSSPTTVHTVTNTNVTFGTTYKKFGTHSATFNGTNAQLSVPDNADFDFSGGAWTVDTFFRSGDSGASNAATIYYQANAADANDYVWIYLNYSSATQATINLSIKTGSSVVVTLESSTVTFSAMDHIRVVESGDNYYIFFNGSLVGYVSDNGRAANCTGTVYIGSDGSGNWLWGFVDEFRVSNSARSTSSFSLPSAPYGTGYASTTYIGSIMPLDGVKLTVASANPLSSGTATMEMHEWNGSGWGALSITDNTAASSRALEQSGTVTWASTAATSIPTAVEKVYQYWYKMVITSASDFSGITLSQVTVSIPFQTVKDIWDGEERPCNSFVVYKSSRYYDYTSNVLENDFSSTGTEIDASTFAKLVSLTTTDYLYAGFIERMAGVTLYIIDDYGNTAAVVVSWEYWNGSAWVALNATDGTLDANKSLARSGWVTWPPANRASEFKRSDLGSGSTARPIDQSKINTFLQYGRSNNKGMLIGVATAQPAKSGFPVKSTGPLYYYRASFSGAISSDVRVYHVAGIPAPANINGYSFPVHHQNRSVLVNNADGAKNSILMSAADTANVYNGLDCYEFPFGGDSAINAAASLFLRFGSSVQDMLLLTKQDEIHILEGNGSDADPYRQRLLSSAVGCRAPLTMATVPVGDLGGGVRRQIVVWESQRGIEVFDGASLLDPLLSHDISDKFDPTHANYAGSSANAGFYDATLDEYHWCPVGAAEWVYSFKFKKWFEIVRGTAKYLYGGIPVMDTSGNSYVFGFDNAGYVHRLENGTTFDGNAIVTTARIGDMAWPEGSIMEKSRINWYRLVAKVGTGTITARYYVDASLTSSHSKSISIVNTGKRLMNVVTYEHDEQAMLHGIEFVGGYDFEPVYLGIRYTLYPDQLS